MSIELADAELVMLSAAARRDDRRLIPAPKPSCLRSTFLWKSQPPCERRAFAVPHLENAARVPSPSTAGLE
jgi:hypothetical protein